MDPPELVRRLTARGLVAVYAGGPDERIVGGRSRVEAPAGLSLYERSFILFHATDGWRLIVSRPGAADLDVVVRDLEAALEILLREYAD